MSFILSSDSQTLQIMFELFSVQRTLSDKVVPIEKKNEIQSFVENFFLHRMVYSLSSNDFAFMDILGIYLYLGAETVLFQYSLDV